MNKNNMLQTANEVANKEKLATGLCAEYSEKMGIKPMYLRGGLIATSIIFSPFLGLGIYGAGLAYDKIKNK